MNFTLAIPHYNEIPELLTSLNYLSTIILDNDEVLVCDNASLIPKNDLREKIMQIIPNALLIVNDKNLGYDRNVDNCIRRSTNDFVWLLGAGDLPDGACVASVRRTIEETPHVTNISVNVRVKGKSKLDSRSHQREVLCVKQKESSVPRRKIDDIYNSALSGNIVNRPKWLEVIDEPLTAENWCHVERILMIHAKDKDAVSIRLRKGCVNIDVGEYGWWNANDCLFLYNVFLHRKLALHYRKHRNLSTLELPSFAKWFEVVSFYAMIKSRAVDNGANGDLKKKTNALLLETPVMWLIFRIVCLLPKWLCKLMIIHGRKVRKFIT